jgi:hypothetical protein
MVTNLVEIAGFALILWFLYILWPPAAILGGGVLLILWANVRTGKGRVAGAIGAALHAARTSYAERETGDATVRRIS